MSKLSETFKPGRGGPVMTRLILMSVILVVVLGALVAVRSGRFGRGRDARETIRTAPVEPNGKTGPVSARVNTEGDSVKLDLHKGTAVAQAHPRRAPAPTPPAGEASDNATTQAPGADNDIFASVLDGFAVTSKEHDAYFHVVAMAWDLGDKNTAEKPLHLKRLELMASPKKYRGRLIRVRGSLLRVRKGTYDPDAARPNRPRQYYECAVKSVEEDPYMVLVFENPLETGDVRVGSDVVWADAYFFKIWGYNDGKMLAPLLIGYRIEKVKFKNTLRPASSLILGGLFVLVILLWLWLRRGRYRGESVRRRLACEDTSDIEIPEPASLPRDSDYDEQT